MTLQEAFRFQARACETLGSPFMAQLMNVLARHLDPGAGTVAAKLFGWPGEVGPSGASLPLRLAGGLHALRLRGDPALAAVYPPAAPADAALWDAVRGAMSRHADFLLDWIDSPPQTNELRRAAVLRAAGHWIAARHGLPLELRELGASAGLNLHWDRYALHLGARRFGPEDAVIALRPEWTGPPPPAATPRIADRRGVDLNPLSPAADGARLRAYTWPDQRDRLARLDAALRLPPVPVDRGDAADWLEGLGPLRPGRTRVVLHTVAWQYFAPGTQRRARAAIEALGAKATEDAPLAWFGMEADEAGPGAGLRLRLWPGDLRLDAGRADFHGRWVHWNLT